VNAPEPRIADALREIAAEAPAPRRLADDAWQAGRRRRWRGVAAAVTAGTGVIVAVIALILAVVGSPAHPSGPPSLAAGPVTLRTPIQFRQVAAISAHGCPANSPAVPGPATAPAGNQSAPGTACYTFTQRGMTVTGLKSAVVVKAPGGGYLLAIRFLPGDAARFAALTSKLVGLPSPHCQLAVVVGDHVLAAPTVDQPITGGQAEIPGFSSRAAAASLLGQG
jgi:hypothetical protein